jgi:CheY-like chemotaxis protein
LARTQTLVDYDAPRDVAVASKPGGSMDDWSSGLRVLLAEDHPINQKVVQLILAPYGAEVTVVENGAQAVEAFQTRLFDVVLMDMQMPLMDGLAATRVIRAHEREQGAARTPIVMLSANAMDHHRQDALVAGADLHIAKPVNAVALMTGIGQVLSPVEVIAS